MTSPFDFDRFWYPPWPKYPTCDADKVCSSSGNARPALPIPLTVFTVHYGGAGTSWTDHGDTAAELRGVEVNWARPNNKPNEYNSAGDTEGQTWEYAGPYRAAHSGGENTTAWGHLCVYGLENLTEAEAQGLILSCRKARAQAVAAGYLTPDHIVEPHQNMPGAKTNCPGPLYENKRWWNQIIAPLDTSEEHDMKALDRPVRWFDTRRWPFGDPFADGQTAAFPLPDAYKGASEVVVNVTPLGNSKRGFVAVWPDGALPDTSAANFAPDGSPNPNLAWTKVGADGKVRFHCSSSAHLVVDIQAVAR